MSDMLSTQNAAPVPARAGRRLALLSSRLNKVTFGRGSERLGSHDEDLRSIYLRRESGFAVPLGCISANTVEPVRHLLRVFSQELIIHRN